MELVVNVNDYGYLPKANELFEEGWQIAEILGDSLLIITNQRMIFDKKRHEFVSRTSDENKEIIKTMQEKLLEKKQKKMT